MPTQSRGHGTPVSPSFAKHTRKKLSTENPTMARGRMRPQTFHGGMALLLSIFGAAMLLLVFRPPLHWAPYLGAWLMSVNVIAFGYYGFDKARARGAASRVPEVVLHGLSFGGGSLGA